MKNNVHAFHTKSNNHVVAKRSKGISLLEKALKKDSKQTSLDFYKIATGDAKEKQRLIMRNYQEAIK